MFYDKNAIMEDLNIEDLLEYVGIKTKRDGKYLNCLCPFHNSHHFKSAVVFKNKGKGFYCFSCSRRYSPMDIVAEYLNININDCKNYKAIYEFLADFNGGKENYEIHSNSEVEFKKGKSIGNKKVRNALNSEIKSLIGLQEYKDTGMKSEFISGNIVKSSDFLDEDDAKKYKYVEHCNKKNLNIEYLYYVSDSNTFSLYHLRNEDPYAYYPLVIGKIEEKIFDIDSVLSKIQFTSNEILAGVKISLEKTRKKLQETLNDVKIESVERGVIIEPFCKTAII